MHSVHSGLSPEEVIKDGMGDPIAVKKLGKGEGLWEYQNEILRWMFDGA